MKKAGWYRAFGFIFWPCLAIEVFGIVDAARHNIPWSDPIKEGAALVALYGAYKAMGKKYAALEADQIAMKEWKPEPVERHGDSGESNA